MLMIIMLQHRSDSEVSVGKWTAITGCSPLRGTGWRKLQYHNTKQNRDNTAET